MLAVTLLAWRVARDGRVALGGLALLVVLGLGTAIVSLSTAGRTADAYPRYLREAEVSELVVNPSVLTDRVSDLIVSAPGVAGYTSDSVFIASIDDGAPRPDLTMERAGDSVLVRASTDGRYLERDRPIVHEGRMIGTGGAEAFLNLEAAEALGARVGDRLPVAFWDAGMVEAGVREAGDVITALGTTTVEVVGIGVLADEVLVDELYPRQSMLVTPDVTAPYDCTPRHPVGDDQPLEEIGAQLYPVGCSVAYRYFSLQLTDGDAGVRQVIDTLTQQLNEESDRLPAALAAEDARFYLVPAVTADQRAQVDRSLDPAVTALRLFGVAALAATVVLSLFAVIRFARRTQPQAQLWAALGATRGQRSGAVALPIAGVLAVGAGGALLAGWLASGIGPVASAAIVEPDPRRMIPAEVVGLVLGVFVLVLGLGVAAVALAAVRPKPWAGEVRPSQLARLAARTGNIPLVFGVRAAVRGLGTAAVLGSAVAAVTAVLGSVVFSTNLSNVIENPPRFGWPYDFVAITGSGYGDANEPAIRETLDRPDVESWGIAALGAATIEGESLPFVADRAGFDRLPLVIVEGLRPTGADQLALGVNSARRLGLTVGDTVTVSTNYGEHTGTVSGLVVLPPVGPILTDRAGLGTGLLLTAPFLEQAMSDAARGAGEPPVALADQLGSFVAVRLADGVDPAAFLDSVEDDLVSWDALEFPPFRHTDPVRPAQIADVAAMRSLPVLLATFVAAATTIGLALAVGLAVRTRRRELALLRALGAVSGQLRATLRWQALTIVGAGVAFGVPLGVALGRVTWRSFSDGLGIPAAPLNSSPWVVVVIVTALAVGLLVAAVPGHLATKATPSTILRRD